MIAASAGSSSLGGVVANVVEFGGRDARGDADQWRSGARRSRAMRVLTVGIKRGGILPQAHERGVRCFHSEIHISEESPLYGIDRWRVRR